MDPEHVCRIQHYWARATVLVVSEMIDKVVRCFQLSHARFLLDNVARMLMLLKHLDRWQVATASSCFYFPKSDQNDEPESHILPLLHRNVCRHLSWKPERI